MVCELPFRDMQTFITCRNDSRFKWLFRQLPNILTKLVIALQTPACYLHSRQRQCIRIDVAAPNGRYQKKKKSASLEFKKKNDFFFDNSVK